MDRQTQIHGRTSKAQAAVEFALVLPVLLLLMFGIIEFGRMLFLYITVTSASREAARYGSAVGANPSGLPRDLDCTGMREAAKRVGVLSGITDEDIDISYDFGPNVACDPAASRDGNPVSGCSCPVGGTGPSGIRLGDRVIANVEVDYTPIVPVDFITHGFPIRSQTARTIIGNVNVGDQIIPPPPPPPSCNIHFNASSVDVPEGNHGGTKTYTVNAQLDGNGCPSIVVPLSYSGTAQQGSGPQDDYQAPTSQIVFAPGGHSASFDILINQDDVHEDDETVEIELGTPSYGILAAPWRLTVNIKNDEDEPFVHFEVASQLVPESIGTVPVKVVLGSQSADTITVNYHAVDVSTLPGDYSITPGTLTFLPLETEKTINLQVIDDTMDEDDEDVQLWLDAPVHATLSMPNPHTITIQDNDLPPLVYFEFESQSVTESTGDFVIKVLLSAQSSRLVTVPFSFTGTATNGQDYTVQSPSPIEVPAGQTSATINMQVQPDMDLNEGIETIVVSMGTPTNATLGIPNIHTVTITLISVSFTIPSQSVLESAGIVTAELRLSGVWGEDVAVPFTVGGTATGGGVDYTMSASPVVIPAGSTSRFITINFVNDDIFENPETIHIVMGNPVNASPGDIKIHDVIIMNDDQPPTVNFTTSSQSVQENDAMVKTITAHLSKMSVMDVSVPFAISGTATSGADFTVLTSSPLTIPAGQTDASISFRAIDDSVFEGNETVVVTMGAPVNAIAGSPSVHTVTIVDNDTPVCGVYDTEYSIDATKTKFTWKLYNNGVNLTVDKVVVQFESSSDKLEVVQFGPTLWTGSLESVASVQSPWVPGADPSFPGFGNYKYMILNFSAGKNLNKIDYIQVSFVGGVCPPYTRSNIQ